MADRLRHTSLRMGGRDPHEDGRVSSSLELLFDLTFVIAYGTAAQRLADALAHGQGGRGIPAFCFAIFAVSWAWINFSWFASAYDTDDWIYRLTTMVQMVGVLILALGIPVMFASVLAGDRVDNRVMVVGYVVMRVPMVAQWSRAKKQDPARAAVSTTMILTLLVAQAGWVLILAFHLHVWQMFGCAAVLATIELIGPVRAERVGDGTPWHPHHIAERYGLLVIVTLGEGLLGTVAVISALVGPGGPGWTLDTAVLGFAGTALTFGLWWTYFTVPFGDLLHAHRDRSFGWGYAHIPLFGALVAVGAGLHAAAYFLQHESDASAVQATLGVAVPLGVCVALTFGLYLQITRSFDPFHVLLVGLSAVVLVAGVALAGVGVALAWCLLVLALTPWITVVGYELVGHRHNQAVLAAL